MEGGQGYWAYKVATLKSAIFCGFDVIHDCRGDALHGAGEQDFLSFGNGQVLVSIYADGVNRFVSSGFSSNGDQTTIASLATGAEDDINTLVDHGSGSGFAPFRIGEGFVQTDIIVVDNVDFGIGFDRQNTCAIAFTKAPYGRYSIS